MSHHHSVNPLLIVFLILWAILDLPLFVAYKLGHPLAYYRSRKVHNAQQEAA